MSLRSRISFASALAATNVKSALALRGASWLQITFMLINNLAFFAIWWIVFDRFEEIRGWRVEHMTALYGISAGAFGLAMVLFGGARQLASLIYQGELDTWLTQPRSVLMQAAMSRSKTSGWGDVLTMFLFLGLSGFAYGMNIPLILVMMLCGTLIFFATNVILHSLAFWLSDMEDMARQLGDFLIVFSTAPFKVFDGWLRVLLFTVIPAGFVGFLPVEIMDTFDPMLLLAVVSATIFYTALACFVFARGLRRYASGNRIGLRTS